MYINGEVDLPEDLVTAQREGKLVIFAGAGLSMGAPSNLPGFKELAEKVAGPAYPPKDNEPVDHYLGRVEGADVDVQVRTREIIDTGDSRPTDLHRHLLSLFPTADDVRLVTTNFDRHFTVVADEVFERRVETYYGPALPLGRNVHGIVYLHGAVERRRSNLVLTDRDFGRAYLTDGWATRMLREMFESFAVLFVGYSHDDTVMQYLARGLLPRTSRFAFSLPGNEGHWRSLGITPVDYPPRSSPDEHRALTDAVHAWVEDANRGTLDHESRLRNILQGSPPIEPELADYVRQALRDPVRLRLFVRYASTSDWLEWVHEEGGLDDLFTDDGPVEDTSRLLAQWFADRFVIEEPLAGLTVVTRRGGQLSPTLWQAIVRRLQNEPRPSADLFARWVTTLVHAAPTGGSAWGLTPLLEGHRNPEDLDATLLLLSHLTHPRIIFDRTLGPTAYQGEGARILMRCDVVVRGEQHLLEEAWSEVLLPNMETFHAPLARIMGHHLAHAYRLLCGTGSAGQDWDPTSFLRSAIEDHPQDSLGRPMDAVINAARDVMAWMLKNNSHLGQSLLVDWGHAEAPLLRRLAIHGIAIDPNFDPEEALARVMAEGWLYATPLKHEVFQLLARAYPTAKESMRRSFIAYSISSDAGERNVSDYERYNVGVWLSRVAPDCDLVKQHLAELQHAHPDFAPRDYPDLDVVMGGVTHVVPTSPVSVDELLAKPAREWMDFLAEYEPNDRTGPSREGLLGALRDATAAKPEWALDLAEAIDTLEDDEVVDVRESIIDGWRDADLDAGLWERVLTSLHRGPNTDVASAAVVRLLHDGLQDESLPYGVVASAETLTDLVFAHADESGGEIEPQVHRDWLTRAINHIGGELAQVWLRALSRHRSEAGDAWSGLPRDYAARFAAVLDSTSVTAQLARTVFASQAAFLYGSDDEWTLENIVPLFDWERDAVAAEQAWHGFLVWGRLSPPLVEAQLPYFRQCFSRLGGELEPHRQSFCQRLAAIALQSTIHPVESGWLPQFIRDASDGDRAMWTEALARQLSSLDVKVVGGVWTRWLRQYWADRVTGSPRRLAEGEATAMVECAIAMKPVFSDAVELVRGVPTPVEGERILLYRLKETDLAEALPIPFARLLEHLLASTSELTYDCSYAEELSERLVRNGAERADLISICQHLARLGCRRAQELRELLDEDEFE